MIKKSPLYNPERRLPEIRYFEHSAKGGVAILACFASYRLSAAPHPSLLNEFKYIRIEFTFIYFIFYMTSLPAGIQPETILAR
jgi:hypothetical protein